MRPDVRSRAADGARANNRGGQWDGVVSRERAGFDHVRRRGGHGKHHCGSGWDVHETAPRPTRWRDPDPERLRLSAMRRRAVERMDHELHLRPGATGTYAAD